MASTYDITTDAGKVRLLISDVGGDGGTDFIFNDDEIAAFLEMGSGSTLRAAAFGLRTLAGNEAMVQKRIKFLELTTDGAATAKELVALAKELDGKADSDEDEVFDVINMNVNLFTDRALRRKHYA